MENNVIVKLDNVTKKFGNTTVIKNFSLSIYEGEFITLLGASGCGKTTVLRIISGLEDTTSGEIYIGGENVTNVDATKREVNTIFQNFALFPKMTVFDNISFGLKMKKVPKDEIKTRVEKVIKLVKLNALENRYPSELSGGQQQRVAIARGIVMNPKVLLLDESLCSLDLKLKKAMQVELKRIQKKSGITFIYVTHAQDEALSMSDRIAIINKGEIVQLGTPEEVYLHPNSVFVADFIGDANIVDAQVLNKTGKELEVSFLGSHKLTIETDKEFEKGDNVKIIVRPEDVFLSKRESAGSIKGVIESSSYSGDNRKLYIEIDEEHNLIATTIDTDKYKDDEVVYMTFDLDYIEVLKK